MNLFTRSCSIFSVEKKKMSETTKRAKYARSVLCTFTCRTRTQLYCPLDPVFAKMHYSFSKSLLMYISTVAEDKFDVGVIHNDEVVEPRADILKQYDKSNLEESCVMVEGDMLPFFLQETAKQKSIKVRSLFVRVRALAHATFYIYDFDLILFQKKIREAFLSKLISRKPEYHKLFVQYGNRDGMEATEMVIPGSNKVSDNAKLQGLNFFDSDWELL